MADRWVIEIDLNAADARAEMNRLANEAARFNQGLGQANPVLGTFERRLGSASASLSTTRYAMYDVSRTLGILGGALVGLTGAIYGAGIAWERDFANVVRTSGLDIDRDSDRIRTLRQNFMDLASTIPIAFSELAEIGTLGGQLGINAGQLSAFTEAVAQLAATSDLSADAAATAFGRLNALLPDVQGNFVGLGSAILAVGTNSVATESEIANTSTQISAMGSFAGLAAADVIGLSGALASVGVKPELARGTITRVFTLMSRAVANGGAELENFARISGVTADEFRRTWGTPEFGDVLLKFMRGIYEEGGNAVAALQELGITSVRDVPALLRVSSAMSSTGEAAGLLTQTFEDARRGFADGTELQRQYSIIAGTVAAKIQLVGNNLQNLFTEIGDGGGVLGGAIDLFNDLLRTLTDIAANPVGGTFLNIGLILTGVIGILALVGAAATAAFASIIAMQQALLGLARAETAVGLSGLLTQMRNLGVISGRTATAIGLVGTAIKGLTVAGVILGIGLIGAELGKMALEASGAVAKVDELATRLAGVKENVVIDELGRIGNVFGRWENIPFEEVARSIDVLKGAGNGFERDFLAGLGAPNQRINNVNTNLKKFDESMAEMAKSGNLDAAQRRFLEFTQMFNLSGHEGFRLLPEYYKQIKLAADVAGQSVNQFLGEQRQVMAQQDALAAALGVSVEELANYESAVRRGAEAQLDLGDAIRAATDDGVFSLDKFNEAMQAQVTALENWQQNIYTLVANGVDQGVIRELIEQGPQVAGQLVQSIVDNLGGAGDTAIALLEAGQSASSNYADGFLSNIALITQVGQRYGSEAQDAIMAALRDGSPSALQAVMDEYNITLASHPMQPQVDTGPAIQRINAFVDEMSRRTIYLRVDTYGETSRYSGPGNYVARASGGPIFGPGSGTSDSILARVSNGEWVIRAASVRKYGHAMLDAINRGAFPAFAGGGSVGGGASFPSSMSLGPVERSLMRAMASNSGALRIEFDPVGVARLANEGNRILGNQGSR